MSAEVTIKFDEGQIRRAIEEATADALNTGAVVLVDAMRSNFGSEGGGVARKQYFKYKRAPGGGFVTNKHGRPIRQRSGRNVYFASPPGSFPGVRTGRLRNSIAIDPAAVGRPYALIGTNLKYGRVLEFGGIGRARDGSKFTIPARPWAVRSMNQAREQIIAAAQRRFTASLASKFR